jgi:cytochrome c biogenesis protein CcmG/thiol:disulfide interchange protein DsbE
MTGKKHSPGSKSWLAFLPLVVFLGLAGMFYMLLTTEDRDISALPSALLDKPVPALALPPLDGLETVGKPVPGMVPEMFAGKLSVVNVFASWCVPCRQEHPQIMSLANDDRWQVIGINHKDATRNARAFLEELGNPYDSVGVDRNGRASIEWGVYGVPETFLVDRNGRIFYKHVGPISDKALRNRILPLLEDQLKS